MAEWVCFDRSSNLVLKWHLLCCLQMEGDEAGEEQEEYEQEMPQEEGEEAAEEETEPADDADDDVVIVGEKREFSTWCAHASLFRRFIREEWDFLLVLRVCIKARDVSVPCDQCCFLCRCCIRSRSF